MLAPAGQAATLRYSVSTSAGVLHPRVLRGRPFDAAATAASSSALWRARSVRSGEILAQQPVGVLVGGALPWAAGITEIDLQTAVEPELDVLGHLDPLVQVKDRRSCSGRVLIVSAIALRTAPAPAPVIGGPVPTLGVLCPSIGGRCNSIVNRLDRSTRVPIADRSVPRIRSPSQCPGTARSSTSAGRSLINSSSVTKLRLPRDVRFPGSSQRPTGPQTSGQFAAQRSTALDIERLIDRLTRHAHGRIIGEVNAEATGDLLRTPALSPATVLARFLTPPAPCDIWTRDAPVRPLHRPRKPVLPIGPQLRVDRELRRLGSLSATLRMPLSGRGSIFNSAASDRSIALQLSGDRRPGQNRSSSERN